MNERHLIIVVRDTDKCVTISAVVKRVGKVRSAPIWGLKVTEER